MISVLFTESFVINITAIIIAIVLYIKQMETLAFLINMLITVAVITIAMGNLGFTDQNYIVACKHIKGNDTDINCTSISMRCFSKYINFKYDTSNGNKTFSC